MWLSSIFLKTLRDYRVPILGWGIGMGLTVVSPMASVGTLISSPQARSALLGLAATFAWNADSVGVDTVGGYATFKIGIFVFLVAIWPLLAASRMLRREEELGSLDVLLSVPRSRVRVALEKVAAMFTALLAIGILIGLLVFAGGSKFGADFGLGGALLFGLNIALVCALVGGLALLISQFTEEPGSAAGWTAALLVLFIVVDMLHRVMLNSDWISSLSPIYWYNLSKPLVPTRGANPGAMLGLGVLALLLYGAAVRLFVSRDVGGTVALPGGFHLPRRHPGRALPLSDWSLRSVFARSLGMVAVPTLWWSAGMAAFAGWMVVAVQQMESRMSALLAASPIMSSVVRHVGGGDARLSAGFLSAIFVMLPLFVMGFAVTQVNLWASDEEDGRLDLLLTTPQTRLVVILARFGALSAATVVICAAALVAAAAAAAATGLPVDGWHLAAALLGMIPLGLLVAAIGYLASGWLRTAADTGLLSFLLLGWFVISFIGPELNWPEFLTRASPLYYYGTPVVHGLQTTSMVALVALTAAVLAVGVLRFSRKDILT